MNSQFLLAHCLLAGFLDLSIWKRLDLPLIHSEKLQAMTDTTTNHQLFLISQLHCINKMLSISPFYATHTAHWNLSYQIHLSSQLYSCTPAHTSMLSLVGCVSSHLLTARTQSGGLLILPCSPPPPPLSARAGITTHFPVSRQWLAPDSRQPDSRQPDSRQPDSRQAQVRRGQRKVGRLVIGRRRLAETCRKPYGRYGIQAERRDLTAGRLTGVVWQAAGSRRARTRMTDVEHVTYLTGLHGCARLPDEPVTSVTRRWRMTWHTSGKHRDRRVWRARRGALKYSEKCLY